jgi:hypothetical protein
MREKFVKPLPEPGRHSKTLTRRAWLLVAACMLPAAIASTASAFQEPISDYQPAYASRSYPYARRYYGAISPYPMGYYSYPNYVYPGAIGGYSVGYYPYAFPPPYRAPAPAYGAGLFGYGASPYGPYPGWGGAYPSGY